MIFFYHGLLFYCDFALENNYCICQANKQTNLVKNSLNGITIDTKGKEGKDIIQLVAVIKPQGVFSS